MEKLYAAQILETLADGINPATGEVLPSTDSCNQPEVIRALHVAVLTLRENKAEKPFPANAGKPWTTAEEDILKRMFENGCSKRDICAYFKRTGGAIAARLVHLGILDNRKDFR